MFNSRLTTHDSRLTAQALLEVAIFGAIIIMLLGALVSYGLRYNFQQQAMQQAFRKSLAQSVKQPGLAVSNLIIKDKYVPNPSDTFGAGSIYPFSGSSGSVMRDYKSVETADVVSELPRVALNIEGSKCPGSLLSPAGSDPPCYYLTAGFRDDANIDPSSLPRYWEVYGQGNICSDPAKCSGASNGECIVQGLDPSGEPECDSYALNIRIIDSCAGEVVDYGTAVKQCRMIVDSAACAKECRLTNESAVDCDSICSQPMNVPWYCQTEECGLSPCDKGVDHVYNFVKLNELFGLSNLKALGLQQDYTQAVRMDGATLRKQETVSGIQTSDKFDYRVTTTRNIIHNKALDDQGISKESMDIASLPLQTTTQVVTCEKNDTDCRYGYKVATCSGDNCGVSAAEDKWPEVKW